MIPAVAATTLLEKLESNSLKPAKSDQGITPEHALWMLHGIRDGYIQNEKAHRWIGHAGAILLSHAYLSLDELKQIFKEAQ